MPDAASFPRYIYGLHEPGGEYLMERKGKPGWIVFTYGLGHDPNNHHGQDAGAHGVVVVHGDCGGVVRAPRSPVKVPQVEVVAGRGVSVYLL